MITDSFDKNSKAIINPQINPNSPKVDACILTFSYVIEKFVLEEYDCKQIGAFWFATGMTPIYGFEYKGKTFAFYKTYVGAPACVGTLEDTIGLVTTDNYIVFGGAGCLDRNIAHGKIMVPTEAYRDEGTSYHYASPSNYISIKNSNQVAQFMKEHNYPYVVGKTWTTDSFYRETINNFEKHKADGCISVEMECASLQAVCDFRQKNLYQFFTSGDLLDAPEWDTRTKYGEYLGTQHDVNHFVIALELARYVTNY